jgi:carboxyl-terminal processing protease
MSSPGRIVGLFLVLLALAAGLYLGGHPGDLPGPIRDAFVNEHTAVTADAEKVIEDNYAKKVSSTQLEDGSLNGMVKSLHDRFSTYFTPRQRKLFEQSIGGEFSGVGMTVVQHRRGLMVTSVFKGSPAAKAHVRPGDLITAVNGKSIAGESSEVATARIKGKPGTLVTLTVVPRGGGRKRTVRIERATIKVPVVRGRIRSFAGRRMGVVQIASFSSGVHGEVALTVRRLLRQGAGGLVIDLRGNGGGLLDEAVLVSSVFVPSGVIVSTKGRKRAKRVLRATGDVISRKPLVVLVDRNTASASEIVTAALKERLGAKVVGLRTFGKGVFGELFDLPNGGAIDLTLGNYYTPKGHNLGGKGITPDVKARDVVHTRRDEALDRALADLAAEVGPSSPKP